MVFNSRIASHAATGTAALASVVAYPFLPNRVATHFTPDGRPDRYGSRAATVLTLPLVLAGLKILNDQLGGWPGSQDRDVIESGIVARNEAIGFTQLALLPVHLAILAKGVGLPVDMSCVNRGVQGVLMVALGNVMPKLPRNGLIGIRTPWSLADPFVWERTHRVGGYLFTTAGLVSLASLPAQGKRVARLPLAAMMAVVGFSAAYSYFMYARRARFSP